MNNNCLKVRQKWYNKKIHTDNTYHDYILQKSKLSHARHKANQTETQRMEETVHHTECAKANREIQKNKKIELKALIDLYKNDLSAIKAAIEFIDSVKWYKVQSLKQLTKIEQTLYSFISNLEQMKEKEN